MKKLIILATLLLPLISLAQDVDAGAGTAIRSDQAERREDGLTYEINAETPYTGLVKGVYPNGQKWSEANFVKGKLEGLYTEWWENGQKQAETNIVDGKKEGLETAWWKTGKKKSEQNFVNGKPNGPVTGWYENGQKKSEATFVDGKQEGLETAWWKPGRRSPNRTTLMDSNGKMAPRQPGTKTDRSKLKKTTFPANWTAS